MQASEKVLGARIDLTLLSSLEAMLPVALDGRKEQVSRACLPKSTEARKAS